MQELITVLRKRYTPFEITYLYVDKLNPDDKVEIVFCEDYILPDGSSEYIGWTPRERAERMGYTIAMSPGDADVIALLDLLSDRLSE